MGYIDIQSREDIDGLIEKTLSTYYNTTVKISDKYTKNSFILNPRLNCAVFSKASKEVKKAVRRGHAVRRNIILYFIMNLYLRFAFSKHGLFGCKYITFEVLPENTEDLFIMPGNMKIKLFDYRLKTVNNIMKEGFSRSSLDKEFSVRLEPKWNFISKLVPCGENGYKEDLLSGCSFDRLENSRKPSVGIKVKDILLKIQQENRKNISSLDYINKLFGEITELLKKLNCDDNVRENICEVASGVINKISKSDITVAFSHGDFQNGNIFVSPEGKVYVLDWETCSIRSLGYDILTFYYSFRYRRDFLMRIDDFINDDNWKNISEEFYGFDIDKKTVLAVYFIEDILWLVEESLSTVERRPSESLLRYADTAFKQEILRRLD